MILFWHRKDLRVADNLGLAAAVTSSKSVVGVFCLDPNILEQDDVAPARVTYLIGCLEALQKKYQSLGSQLLILNANPEEALPRLAKALNAEAVHWNLDVEPYAQARDKKVTDALQEVGVKVETFWDQLLHSPGEILSKTGGRYTVYTPFWKNWIAQAKKDPTEKIEHLEGLTEQEEAAAKQAGAILLPSAKDLGYEWENPLLLAPGEAPALERLEEFCQKAINEYQQERNFPGVDGTSRLSAALKFGAIGIRTVWQKTQEALSLSRSDEVRDSVTTWQQELAWREFYQHSMYFSPELAQSPFKQTFQDFPWENNEEHFQAWCEGKTGYPIVDAAMRQLNETGWMHNRTRMIVASFLTKDLIINWQWGEKYFMQKLYDGDLSANNGGWQWSASCGLDPKPLRIFNPTTQGQKFDPEGQYMREWLPELSAVDPEFLVNGKISDSDRRCYGYPLPIVDHKIQQAKFKQLYKGD